MKNSDTGLRKKLIWKYFWQRKRQEVGGFFRKTWPIWIIAIWLVSGVSMAILPGDDATQTLGVNIILTGMCLIYLCILGAGLYLLGREFVRWLCSNWEWATEDADRELNYMNRSETVTAKPGRTKSYHPSKKGREKR